MWNARFLNGRLLHPLKGQDFRKAFVHKYTLVTVFMNLRSVKI